mgnify:CR=1 FL=1
MRKYNLFITGVAGFIGHNLTKKLLIEGYSVLGIDILNDYYDVNLKHARLDDIQLFMEQNKISKENFKFVKMDLKNKDNLFNLLEEQSVEKICHLAAQAGVRYSLDNPYSYVGNNITATLNLLEASRKYNIKDFIFSSTSSVYGLNQDMPFKEDANIDTTVSAYSATKRSCELLCHSYHHNFGIRFRILRFFTVYGPWGRPDMAYFSFTKKIINGSKIEIYNKGEMERDFTFIEDITDGFISAIFDKSEFEIINLGAGRQIKLMEFVVLIQEELKRKAIINYLPMQMGDVKSTWADISKAHEILKYKPKIDFEIGIHKFISWYKEFYEV